ncbi:MAG: hypothetical protein LBS18_08495 [Clostridiales bacterium]|jgi:vacuolar-type H+-ATPase subunit H|nr:hypothetical protein [Clostridiales bacterium]
MHSIIEEITLVEQQANKLRQDAVAAAREQVAAARIKKEKELAALDEDLRLKLDEAVRQAEQQGESASAEILQKRADESKAACDKARAHMPAAVDYIMERVVDEV